MNCSDCGWREIIPNYRRKQIKEESKQETGHKQGQVPCLFVDSAPGVGFWGQEVEQA